MHYLIIPFYFYTFNCYYKILLDENITKMCNFWHLGFKIFHQIIVEYDQIYIHFFSDQIWYEKKTLMGNFKVQDGHALVNEDIGACFFTLIPTWEVN